MIKPEFKFFKMSSAKFLSSFLYSLDSFSGLFNINLMSSIVSKGRMSESPLVFKFMVGISSFSGISDTESMLNSSFDCFFWKILSKACLAFCIVGLLDVGIGDFD